MSKKILIINAHTYFKDSTANKEILEQLKAKLPQAEIIQLNTLYPDHKINVKAEQQRLEKADVIVLQFPMFWFNYPSLMQLYLEEVFAHGWAYGSTGHALKGKKLIISVTTGDNFEDKVENVEKFYVNLKHTASFTGMEYSGIVLSVGYSYINGEEAKKKAIQLADKHANDLVEKLKNLK